MAATSLSPAVPFAPLPQPLHCTPGHWSIDPYPVTDGHRWYLLWRQDDGANVTGRIVGARLSQAPGALRVAWAYRVEPSRTPAGYRLIEIARNHPAQASVSEA
jgi:hypothetical protein